jgi:diguanylate cyclase (GGDEF)-like protein
LDIQLSGLSADEAGGLWKAAVATTTDLLKIFAFSDFFNEAAESLANLLDADGAALIVYDGPEHLKYRLFYGMEFVNQEAVVKFKFPIHQGTVGRVLATGQYLFTEDYPNSADAMPEFVAAGLKSNMVVPLPGPNGLVGALAISWINRSGAWLNASALAIVEMFAALIGASLHRENLEDQLKSLSLQDPLTGLPNRRMLMVQLAEAQKRACRHQTLLVVAVLDLDGFKRLNDVFGHAEGDKALIWAAGKIQGSIRSVDMAVRLGGDEFVIILESVASLREAQMILNRVLHSLHLQVDKDGMIVNLHSSIGATVYPIDFVDPESLLRHADEAMYAAKRAGGDKVMIMPDYPQKATCPCGNAS